MPTLLRTTLLAVFAACGIGVAIAIAMQPAAEQSQPAARRPSSPPWQNASTGDEELSPTPATYRPAVASQSGEPSSAQPVSPPTIETQPAAAAPPPVMVQIAPQPHPADETLNRLKNFLDVAEAAHAQNAASKAPQPEVAEPQTPEPLPAPPPTSIRRDASDNKLSINVQNSDIREVLELLSQQGNLNILASKSVTGTVTASLSGVDIETALAAILKSTGYVARREDNIIYVGTPADFLAMDQIEDRLITRVYRPNYVKAAELQALIVPMLTPEVGRSTVSSPAEVDIPADQTKTGGDSFADSDVVIVRDYAAVIAQVDQIFCEVDVKPRQVSIEAMILSVKLSDEYKFGVDFALLRNEANVRIISGKPLNSIGNLSFNEGGLHFAFLDDSTGVFINALEKIGDTNVIASPRLMCLNKQRAEIQIGEELGYISTTVTETSAVQTVNFLDVGTLLRIRPFITNDGQIRMELHPELSKGTVREVEGQTIPNKTVTQVTTNVVCPDGATIIIGGLIGEDLQSTIEQIPWLGSLPYVGPAFRSKTEKVDRVEVIVLITPRIVSEPMMSEEAVKYGNEFIERQSVYFDKMSPLGRRNLGNHWLRKARAAYAAQEYNVAMRQVNMAIHYDPVNRDAINLRNEIVVAGGFEDESIHEYLHLGLPPQQRALRDYSKKGYPWKTFEGFSTEPEISHIPDRGQPGAVRTLEPDLTIGPTPVIPVTPVVPVTPVIPVAPIVSPDNFSQPIEEPLP